VPNHEYLGIVLNPFGWVKRNCALSATQQKTALKSPISAAIGRLVRAYSNGDRLAWCLRIGSLPARTAAISSEDAADEAQSKD